MDRESLQTQPTRDQTGFQHAGEWTEPKPEVLPRPTYWPAVLALGVAFVFWGLVASLVITIIGLTLTGLALAGWIGEVLRERKRQ
jgi:hypothetical protein